MLSEHESLIQVILIPLEVVADEVMIQKFELPLRIHGAGKFLISAAQLAQPSGVVASGWDLADLD